MNIKPLHDNVVIKPITEENTTKSGIVLPTAVENESPEQGEVIAIGQGRLINDGKRMEMTVSIGDIVLFKKYSPDKIKIEGDDYLIISENDILAII